MTLIQGILNANEHLTKGIKCTGIHARSFIWLGFSDLGGVYMTPGRLSPARSEFTPVPSHGSIFVYMISPQISYWRESIRREFTAVLVKGREFHSGTKSRNGITRGTLSKEEDDGSENFVKKMNLRSFKLNRVYLNPLNMSNAGDVSWS